jgi:hypothetical protein
MFVFDVEYTDTFAGEANYFWRVRKTITMPELTHYGYDGGTNYCKTRRIFERELMRKAKAALGLTGVRGQKEGYCGFITFYPCRSATVVFITPREGVR